MNCDSFDPEDDDPEETDEESESEEDEGDNTPTLGEVITDIDTYIPHF